MASDTKLGLAARNAACQAVVELLNAGSLVVLNIYSGAPASDLPSAPPSGQLVIASEESPCFSSASAGASSASFTNGSIGAQILQSGTAGHFILSADASEAICQGTCGDSGDAPVDLEFDDKQLVAGGRMTAHVTITMPE